MKKYSLLILVILFNNIHAVVPDCRENMPTRYFDGAGNELTEAEFRAKQEAKAQNGRKTFGQLQAGSPVKQLLKNSGISGVEISVAGSKKLLRKAKKKQKEQTNFTYAPNYDARFAGLAAAAEEGEVAGVDMKALEDITRCAQAYQNKLKENPNFFSEQAKKQETTFPELKMVMRNGSCRFD